MKLFTRAIALFLCVFMLLPGPLNALAAYATEDDVVVVETTDTTETVEVCEECGQTEGHLDTCSQYVDPNACAECGQTEGHLEDCSQYVIPAVEVCTECGQAEGHLETCSQYVAPAEEAVETDDPQVGDKIWIKSGSKVYKNYTNVEKNYYELKGNYEIKIVEILTDENGTAEWYKFEFTSLGIGEIALTIGGYKYVHVDNTSVEEPKDTEPSDSEKETTVGDIALKVQGVPENVTLGAETVAPKSWNEAVFDAVGNHKVVFAIDIALTGENGAWQPDEGQSVTVSLDAASLGLADGDRIGILHDHDGTLGNLGIYTVADGKLTFTTDGFSVFYGYTVDFEYDGTWVSMSGGSYIYLSELFEALGISESVNNVGNVTFSNEALLSVTHLTYIKEEGGGQDWRLCSMQPFDTEELLTVTLNNGEEIIINVYDKNWGTEDIDGNETWADGDTQGNRTVTANSTITLNEGATVKLSGTITIPEGKTLTIQCNGDATLERTSGNTAYVPLFNVNGGKLVIESTSGTITVDGNKVAVGRAAFVVGNNSRANRNTENDNGGSTLTLTNVTIKDCYCNDNNYGGAIHLITGSTSSDTTEYYRPLHNLTLTNCVIDNCRAPHGSAIYFTGNSMGKATITDTVIKNCVSYGHKAYTTGDDQGGTIRSNGANGTFVVLERCIIQNNRSGYSDLNTAKTGFCCYGGGIYWNAAGDLSTSYTDTIDPSNTRAKMYIYDCQILDNKATNRGGGIFNEAAMYIGTKYTEGFTTDRVSNTSGIKGTLIAGNYAGGYTGTSYTNCGGGVMVPSYTGGASESQDMNVSLNMGVGVYITNNSSDNGGGFAMQINETADKGQGVTFSVDYTGAVIENNTAVNNGGGIYIIMSTNLYNANLNLTSGSISRNSAKNGGGIYVENTNINISTSDTTSDNAVRIQNNTATGNGGGIYLKQETAYQGSVQINVSNGYVTGNTATKFGGGIYQTGKIGNCVVSGEGKISNNTAANGGGIYIAGGSKLSVTGGIITGNYATGENTVNVTVTDKTAYQLSSGVGGGIYVNAGTFVMSGDAASIGIYGNLADFAADDAYASGDNTTLTLPDVSGMKLDGSYANAEGWFADYVSNDTKYTSDKPFNFDNNGRYRTDGNVDNLTGAITAGTYYYCLTLGRIPSLVITKVLDSSKQPDNSFMFAVTKPDGKTINVVIPASAFALNEDGKMEASVTVAKLATGTYTVTEIVDWSWRYSFDSAVTENDTDYTSVTNGVQFTLTTDGEEAIFTNSRTENKWLSGDCYAENWWGNNGNVVRKDDDED